jgi:hypothetical protein
MTNAEAAELRGEIYGLKALVANCLAFNAALTDNPAAHLQALQNETVAGIAAAENDAVRVVHLPAFRAAAAGLVLQLVEYAKAIHIQVPPRDRLQ